MRFLYKNLLKPLLFLFPPETVHDFMTTAGRLLGHSSVAKSLTRSLFHYENKRLEQKIGGIVFKNPIGLSAGFDYEANLTQILPSVGFGFMTVGSITWGEYAGNPAPRLGRLPKSKSLLVNKGLKSTGAQAVFERIKDLDFEIPVGISIAKTNSQECADEVSGINDYYKSLEFWEDKSQSRKKPVAAYYEINISCPNAYGGEPFTTKAKLEKLLAKLRKIKTKTPLFVKMPIELPWDETRKLLDVCVEYKIPGVIFGNLAKDRSNPTLVASELKKVGKGNFSGKPTWEKSNEMIAKTYLAYKNKLIIIGSGGVFSAEDAYIKIKLGASLIQLITGMVFEGPQLIGEINRGIVGLLENDNKKSVSEVVGVSALDYVRSKKLDL